MTESPKSASRFVFSPRTLKRVILRLAFMVSLASGCVEGGAGGCVDGNEVGDRFNAVQEFLIEGLTYVTPDGEVETRFDERLRPIQVTGRDLSASFAWSDDARTVELTATTSSGPAEALLAMDFSDAALLETIDQAEAETGMDVGFLREWIAENPGLVERVASGQEPAPRPSAKRSVLMQDLPRTQVQNYLGGLNQAWLAIREVHEAIIREYIGGGSPVEDQLRQVSSVLDSTLRSLYELEQEQREVCSPRCTLACRVPCVDEDHGACCRPDGSCEETEPQSCAGRFWQGFGCGEVECDRLSACCLDDGSCQEVLDQQACDDLLHSSTAAVAEFFENETCAEVRAQGLCGGWVCCVDSDPPPFSGYPDWPVDCFDGDAFLFFPSPAEGCESLRSVSPEGATVTPYFIPGGSCSDCPAYE